MRLGLATLLFFILFRANIAFAGDFVITSEGFDNNGRIPITYTCNGRNIPPPLQWSNAPPKTQSFVIVFSSLDEPTGPMYLWVVYNIPSSTHSLNLGGRNLPSDAITGLNSDGAERYYGPCPPDSALHHYLFELYAVDAVLYLPDDLSADDVLSRLRKHVLAKTCLIATFSH